MVDYHMNTMVIGESDSEDTTHEYGAYVDDGNKARGAVDSGPPSGYQSKDDSKDNEVANVNGYGYATAYLTDDGTHIDDLSSTNPFRKTFNKFKFKFSIGEDIFGVKSKDKLMEWVNALKTVVDFNQRETDKYDDERNYLCVQHLELLIFGFIGGPGFKAKDPEFEMGLNVKKCVIMFIGDQCWDNTALIAF